MANRRMFSKDIVQSGKFLDMPISSQALYFHLGMIADDDGYAEYKIAMKLCGASVDDLRVLAAKDFVKIFDEYVLVVKQWNENNYIQKDRYTPSRYLNVYSLDTESIQVVNTGKGRIGKVSINTMGQLTTQLKEKYPDIDVEFEIQRADEWLADPALNKRGRKGAPAFYENWIKKAQQFSGKANELPDEWDGGLR